MIRRLFLTLVILVSAVSASADGRFTIDRIEVRNAERLPAALIARETLLREGSEVSEEDVRAGVRRLVCLPFVFRADYALEAAGEPSRRVVVVTVKENRRFWFLVDGRGILLHEPAEATDYDFVDPTAEWKHAAAGMRWLFGDGGVAHFGMTVLRTRNGYRKNYSAYELGYTRYGLAGTRLFATAIVRSPVDSLEEKTFTPKLVVGFPIAADDTLTLQVEDTSFRDTTKNILNAEFRELHFEREYSAAWTHDTRNDPYAAMRGAFLRVEPYAWMSDYASFSFARPPQLFTSRADHTNTIGVDVTAERHWPLTDVSSIRGLVMGGWASTESRQNPAGGSRQLRWRPSYEVVGAGVARKIRGFHVEVDGRVMFRQISSDQNDGALDDLTGTSYELGAAWVWRNPRATIRLGFAYTNL